MVVIRSGHCLLKHLALVPDGKGLDYPSNVGPQVNNVNKVSGHGIR